MTTLYDFIPTEGISPSGGICGSQEPLEKVLYKLDVKGSACNPRLEPSD
jgi:hypothetical protein